jgi:hypothetical protein
MYTTIKRSKYAKIAVSVLATEDMVIHAAKSVLDQT